MAASRAASSSVVQCASVSNTRFAMFAAAALVKVMQRIFSGSTPASSRLITRCASTCVLPDPALAATQAETRGIGHGGLHAPHVGGNDVRRSHGITICTRSSGPPVADHSLTRAKWS